MPKIVSRRVNGGIRYGGSNQERHEAKQRVLEKKVRGMESDDSDLTERKATTTPKPLFRERIRWTAIPRDEFDLDCAEAIRILVSKLNTYTEFNKQLILEFIAELRKCLAEDGAKAILKATGTGGFLDNKRAGTFLRLEHRLGDGEVREHVLPAGFRDMCRSAITRKVRPSNDMFFSNRRKPGWKQRIPYD